MNFLTANWLDLVMVNWEVPPALFAPLVPAGTELDSFEGRYFASIVAFRFENTRVLGLYPPFHSRFEEVNLRFYVKRTLGTEVRRGVVFVKEIVPRALIAFVARALYNEPYVAAPMSHRIESSDNATTVRYEWQLSGTPDFVTVDHKSDWRDLAPGSLEEFIAEHYWGYTRQRDGGTVEYRVSHPCWRFAPVSNFKLSCRIGEWYGEQFAAPLGGAPASMFIAEGSPVAVKRALRV